MTILGIYKIYCTKNNKSYIGSSINIKYRWAKHKNALKSNRHSNEHLQNAWNKYGESSFIFSILEEVLEDRLLEREQFWINNFQSWDRKFGFNKAETARPHESRLFKRDKSYIVTHPDGNEEEVINLEGWERKHGFCAGSLGKVARGTQNQHRGYTCRFSYQTQKEWESTLIRNPRHGANPKWEYTFICPDGSKIVTNRFNDFCKEHSLNSGCMNETLLGRKGRKHHKGYTCSRRSLSK